MYNTSNNQDETATVLSKQKPKEKLSQKIDFFFNKLLPKKLIVWSVATIFVFMGKLDGEWWAYISLAYLGVNIIGKFSRDSYKKGGTIGD